MIWIAFLASLFFASALVVSEQRHRRERRAAAQAIANLHSALEVAGQQIRQCREEIFVVRALLQERGLVSERDLTQARERLIEEPRRQAEERRELVRGVTIAPNQVIIDENKSVH